MTPEEIRAKHPNDVEAEKVAQLAEIKELLSVYLPTRGFEWEGKAKEFIATYAN